TGKPFVGLPLGAAKVAVDASGRAALVAEGGRAFVSDGARWSDVTAKVPLAVSDIVERDGALYFVDASSSAARLDPAGPILASLPPLDTAAPRNDPRWRPSGSPLEAAVATGAPWADGQAIVAAAGSVYVVSTSSGAVVDVEDGAVPPDAACEATRLGDRVLFLCQGSGVATAFARAAGSRKTELEHSFASEGTFVRGAGDALLFMGPCAPRTTPPSRPDAVACARIEGRGWTELDRSGEISDTPPGQPLRVAAWIPKNDGATIVLGGKDGGLMDATTGARDKLDAEDATRLEALFQISGRVSDRSAVLADGTIVGFGRDGVGFRVTNGGRVIERSAFRMQSPVTSGARALARASATPDSLWLSSDYGFTYAEIAGTPLASESPSACSDVGCTFRSWLRVGWDTTAPLPPAARRANVGPSVASSAQLPLLSCKLTGTMTRKAVAPGGRFGFGAELVTDETTFLGIYPRGGGTGILGPFEALDLRAAITGKAASPDAVDKPSATFTQPRRLRWVEPFDGKGTVREATLKLSDLFDAARSAGGTPPDPTATDDRGLAVVVGSRDDDATVIVSGSQLPLIWARGKDKPVVMSAGLDAQNLTLESAVRVAPDAVTALFGDGSGTVHVRTLGPGRTDELFALPPPPSSELAPQTPDTVALSDDGAIGVIRVLGFGAPTSSAPALLLLPGAAPVALAPWSTLEDATSPACAAGHGFHAVITSRAPWVRFGAPLEDGSDHVMIAKVRWGTDRVCLDGIEVSAVTHDLPEGLTVESYIAARFGKDASAGHVMVAEGAELREPRTCSLVSVAASK
ncbi:MAG TPA: hypothetical protein VL400_20445, partial [Polyangiaceae bacterium]|nr:hypothetical protein [Polyangiaceae bacterium]